jgi:Flp pilus assembly protein TadG
MPTRKVRFRTQGGSLWRDQDGSALIEGAVVVPVLMAFFFGVFAFSWFFYQQHLVVIGLHEAASYLARSSDPCNATSRAWTSDENRAKLLATSGSFSGAAARVRGWTPNLVKTQCAKVDNPTAQNGLSRFRGKSVYVVTVSTRVAPSLLDFFDLLHLPPPVISASYSERAIDPR